MNLTFVAVSVAFRNAGLTEIRPQRTELGFSHHPARGPDLM
jgi:hypothetical protein